jgi:hypothetical protein
MPLLAIFCYKKNASSLVVSIHTTMLASKWVQTSTQMYLHVLVPSCNKCVQVRIIAIEIWNILVLQWISIQMKCRSIHHLLIQCTEACFQVDQDR